jgi:hypothetical protein
MRKTFWFLFISVLTACQCLVPVPETSDASDQALIDAGSSRETPDSGNACRAPSDCPPLMNRPDRYGGRLAPTCLNGRCVYEFVYGDPSGVSRVCRATAEQCLDCGPDAGECPLCTAPMCRMQIEWTSECPGPFQSEAVLLSEPPSGERCTGNLTLQGGSVGIWRGGDGDQVVVLEIPSLGGACVARGIATGLPRVFVSCPACSFVASGCVY